MQGTALEVGPLDVGLMLSEPVEVEWPVRLVAEVEDPAPIWEPVFCLNPACCRIYTRPLTGTTLERSVGCPFCEYVGYLSIVSYLPRIRLEPNELRAALARFARPLPEKEQRVPVSAHVHYQGSRR